MAEIHMWLGGRFEYNPSIRYIGGRMFKQCGISFDDLNISKLYDVYEEGGGGRGTIHFYWQMTGLSLDEGLRKITYYHFKDWGIIECEQPIVIYTEEIHINRISINTQGEILVQESQLCPDMEEIINNIDFTEHNIETGLAGTNYTQEEYETGDFSRFSCGVIPTVINEDGPVQKAKTSKNPQQRKKTIQRKKSVRRHTSKTPVNAQVQGKRSLKKRKATCVSYDRDAEVFGDSSRSEFDDSSDSDFQGEGAGFSSESDGEDMVPDAMLDDLEDSDDDNILVDKNPTKAELVAKLRKMRNKEKLAKAAKVQSTQTNPIEEDDGWYTDCNEDDGPHQLDATNSDGEKDDNLWFREGTDLKLFKPFIGQHFSTAQWFRECLRDYCIRQGFDLHFIRNENARITARCLNEQFTWRIHASPIQGSSEFQIKTLKGDHVCCRTYTNKLAKTKYLAGRIEKLVRENPGIPVETLKQTIKRKVDIDASKWKVARVKKAALHQIHGSDSKQYELLWDYCETVRARNPGSKILLKKKEGTDPPVFERMYFSLAAMKNGFLVGCRPIIQLDGCFLKTIYGGQLLVAISRDGNDNMWPIAMAVVPVENRVHWTWFLQELLDDIGMQRRWTFLSDRQKGLVEAVKELFPESEHRYCVRHFYQNFKSKFKTNELKELFWKAASTGSKVEFERLMKRIEKVDPKIDERIKTAAEWMMEIPPQQWTRSHFETICKCDVVVNNLSESFNAYILVARSLPIISMFEWIRTKLMIKIQQKRSMMDRYQGTICPNIMKKIKFQQKLARNCFATYCGGAEYEIHHMLNVYIVDLHKRICSCGMFQLFGYPCCHAHAAITEKREQVENFVDPFFTKELYLQVYDNMIHGVPGQDEYIKTTYEPLRAPHIIVKRGRPTKARRKGADEGGASTRRGLTHTCQRCLTTGHNRGSCTNPPHPKSKFYKGQPQSDVQPDNQGNTATMGPQAAPVTSSRQSSRPAHARRQSSRQSSTGNV